MYYTRIIFFKNAVETLTFFSRQLAYHLKENGADVLFVDIDHSLKNGESSLQIRDFALPEKTLVVTFNFIGLSGEEQFLGKDGGNVFDELSLPVFNIIVDHPLYYYSQLMTASPKMHIFTVDREHLLFMKNYYPHLKNLHFMPLAGSFEDLYDTDNESADSFYSNIPFGDRPYNLVFPANYVSLDNINDRLSKAEPEYRDFYMAVTDDLLKNTDKPLDIAFKEAILREFPDATIGDAISAMRGMLFIDLYIRSTFRNQIASVILDSGIPVLFVGKDWEKIDTKRPDLMTVTGQVNTVKCLSYMKQSKITLNIMPWFKDGAHDRIFSGMMCKSAVLTDLSPYLQEVLSPKDDLLTFSLDHIDDIPKIIDNALCKPEQLLRTALHGYETAAGSHTWKNRADYLIKIMG